MNQGRTVFSQLTDLLPRYAFSASVERYSGNRKVASFSCKDQLLCMLFAQFTGRTSLRQTVEVLRALGPRRYHCGIRGTIARSTLADANEKRDYRVFEEVALAMIESARLDLPIDPDLLQLEADVFALDSTTIDLCLKLFPWAVFRRRKGGVKAHTLLDVGTGIPVFIRVSNGKTHDLWMLDQIVIQPGAFYVMDRGYIDFRRLHRVHTAPAFFVTRGKRNMDCSILERRRVPHQTGVTSDHVIRLGGYKSCRLYPDTLRVVRYRDPDTGKRLEFLTNNMVIDSPTVAMLYRKRWQIELFFKWAKQHLHIKAFFGTTPNAVKTQIWIAVIACVLLALLKQHRQLPQELNTIMQVLSVTLLEKTPVFELFRGHTSADSMAENRNQLMLFE
jgi:IS4 transposase